MNKLLSTERIGRVVPLVVNLLELEHPIDDTIYIGESNRNHMADTHPEDYKKYGGFIADILQAPDYIGQNPKDNSIEYVKEFVLDGEFVKVAVRVSGAGRFYARSLYVLNKRRTQNFIANGTLKKVST
ncbi:PBECR2 nuclease fold domain-containing protein [Bengtsoniella intestinalis]|uniref:PBECR3 domain-containing polyvalent protein n=1 Tax=Bengtsoniella intestinalis TaxID=3073143 RepID=UPI00391F65A0